MWQVIGPALDQEWALDGVAWFVGVAANLRAEMPARDDGGAVSEVLVFRSELEKIAAAIAAHHMRTAKLAPVCLAYSGASDPASLKLLEKIESTHALKPVQGVAALAIAIRLRSLGDEPELMSRRLTLLKKAIIESADMEIEGTPVTQLIREELYVVTNLTKGRTAPQLAGMDSAGRPMRLADYRGKIVVLLFWNSAVTGVVPLLESLTKFSRESDGKVVIVGVNNDAVENLRTFQREDADLLDFPNFSDPRGELATVYRVGAWPLAYVIDANGAIAYSGIPGAFMQAAVKGLLEAKPR
jgi:peroxiredoxin